MKKFRTSLFFCLISCICFSIIGCSSNKKKSETLEPDIVIAPTPVIEEKQAVNPEAIQNNDEFTRSTVNLKQEISIDTFNTDKLAILKTISELNTIMYQKDFYTWKKYLSKDSLQYWSNPQNLSEVSKKLPIKGYELTSLEDYFNLIFIPARIGREIGEIRYISEDNVKAVQVQGNRDIIYYSFIKINDKWLLNLEK